jgi:hypothetical protein
VHGRIKIGNFPAISWLAGFDVFAMLSLLQLMLGKTAPFRGKLIFPSSLVLLAFVLLMQKSIPAAYYCPLTNPTVLARKLNPVR